MSLAQIKNGAHKNNPENSYLIQIVDVGMEHPEIKGFRQCFKFNIEDNNQPDCITEEDARLIDSILRSALSLGFDITVHCVAGLSRSGAVAEYGEILGFKYIGNTKIPNVIIKTKLLNLGGFYSGYQQ